MIKWLIILFPLFSFGQTTLPNAKAYRADFITTQVFGIDNNSHIYGVGFRLNYSGGVPQEMEVAKIDYTAASISYKAIPGSVSSPSVLWSYVTDSNYHHYFGLNSGNRYILKLDLLDSIRIWNLGTMPDGVALGYSCSLALNGHILFGGSSGGITKTSTDWIDIDPETNIVTDHTTPDTLRNYCLSINGDNEYTYLQLGQNSTIDFWAVRNADNYKKKLASISSSSRFNVGTYKNGVFVQYNNTWHKATDTTLTAQTPSSADLIVVHQVSDNVTWFEPALPQVRTFFDEIEKKLYIKTNGVANTINLSISQTVDNIKLVIPDPVNSNIVYYVADYYGYMSKYFIAEDSVVSLGKLGMNIYSYQWLNDTTCLLAGYPSSKLLRFNKNQNWTLQKYNAETDAATTASANTNPALIDNMRTYSDVHHPYKMLRLANGIVCGFGAVERVATTAGMWFYNPATNERWGLNADSLDRQYFRDAAAWGNKKIIMSSNNTNGGTPKLFVYDTQLRTLVDSISFGWTGYGKITIIGDQLSGVTDTRLYKINLSTKQLIYNYTLPAGTINYSVPMPDGYFGINVTGGTIPRSFGPTRSIANATYYYAGNGTFYTISNTDLIKRTSVSGVEIDPESAYGKYLKVKKTLQ